MLKGDKLSDLKKLINKLKLGGKKKTATQIQGKIVQILKSIYYFKTEANNYGTEVLLHYIPLIQPYMLRAGMQIIGCQQEYVIVEGLIKGVKPNGEMGNIYTDGMIVQPLIQQRRPQNQRQMFYCTDSMDTALIKICRNNQDQKLYKFSQILSKFQKQRAQKSRQNQIILIADKSLKVCKQNLKKHQFFTSLGTFDINDIVVQSKFLKLNKGTNLHSFGESVTKIGFLISGQVRVDNSVLHEKSKPVQPGKLILDKYMVHRKEKSSSVVSFIQAGEWIGLQQFFWSQDCFLSNAQVTSHDAEIIMIPTQIFEKKFNEQTSYFLINKIKGLIQTKKKLLQKSIKAKKQKQQQMMEQKQKQQAIQKFKERMRSQNNQSKRNTQLLNYIINQNDQQHPKKRDYQSSYPKQCYMPERLIHKIKVFQQKYSSLPKIKQRLVLFPEQYEKAMIPLDLQQELKMINNLRNKNQNKKNSLQQPFRLLSSQKVYETVIYNSLSPKNNSNPERVMPRIRSKASIHFQSKKQLFQTMDQTSFSSRTHYNKSICNNFQAPKIRGQKLQKNSSKTLEII